MLQLNNSMVYSCISEEFEALNVSSSEHGSDESSHMESVE